MGWGCGEGRGSQVWEKENECYLMLMRERLQTFSTPGPPGIGVSWCEEGEGRGILANGPGVESLPRRGRVARLPSQATLLNHDRLPPARLANSYIPGEVEGGESPLILHPHAEGARYCLLFRRG